MVFRDPSIMSPLLLNPRAPKRSSRDSTAQLTSITGGGQPSGPFYGPQLRTNMIPYGYVQQDEYVQCFSPLYLMSHVPIKQTLDGKIERRLLTDGPATEPFEYIVR